MTRSIRGCRIRLFHSDDRDDVDSLVDDSSDPLWIAQGHALHGEASDGERWRRTLVAESHDRIVAAATAATNPVHPGRYSAAVEVAPAFRGRGLAGVLVAELQQLRPEPLPFAGKLRPGDAAGVALLRKIGGRAYQSCPGARPDPGKAQIAQWCRARVAPPRTDVAPLATVPRDLRAELWTQQYLWVHERWSPAAPGPLARLAPEIVEQADAGLSVVTTDDGIVDSVTWVFPEPDGSITIVSETTRRVTRRGVATVAVGLATCLQLLAARGSSKIELDGHASDPHLDAVVRSLPAGERNPLLLVEI